MTSTRLIVVTGKGGVGKTTTAAATALAAAKGGRRRVLVVSTDPAHSLADALDHAVGDQPTAVTGTVHALQIDARHRFEEQWGDLRRYVADVLQWAGLDDLAAEELTLLPGLDEVIALTALTDLCRGGAYDVVVVDCAPTAETVRLLSLPDVLGSWIHRLFPIGRQVTTVLGPVVRGLTDLPVPQEPQFAAVERLQERLSEVRALLADRATTSVRLVVNPEAVVVAEARRTATYLSMFGFAVDAVIVNRLLPDEVTDPWFDRWRASQAEQLRTIEEGFAPVPVLRVPLQHEEPVGAPRLRAVARSLYGRRDPAGILFDGAPLQVDHRDGAWELHVELPFTERSDVGLVRRDDELVLTVGPYRRAILLPDSLAERRVEKATVRQGRLTVHFGEG